MSNNTQSSVEYLMDKLFDPSSMVEEQLEWFEQAKAMHKEEIIHSFNKGCKIGVDVGSNHDYHEGYNSEQYYNETFGGDK